jgi:Rps23 Pro-64 3,4-dihydroxylase Tpa1-like proline 4-hydroxylase
MSIKKPSMIKPTMKKPVGPKKAVTPKAPVEEVKEEIVVQQAVIGEPIAEEVSVPAETPTEEVEQVVEEVVEQAVEEPEVQEEVKEEKTKTKKTSKKAKAKKEEPKEETQEVQEQLPQMSLQDSIDAMADSVNITTDEWEEAKQEIEDKLKSLTIDPDMNPSSMKHLIGDLDDLMTELRFRLVEVEGQVEFINARVDFIRSTNSKGSNAEERKANAFLALTNYKKNPDDTEVINLIQYQIFMNNKLNFLNKSIETVRDRRQLLITFNSCMKIESTI